MSRQEKQDHLEKPGETKSTQADAPPMAVSQSQDDSLSPSGPQGEEDDARATFPDPTLAEAPPSAVSRNANLELRSEEVQDILNRPPNWMVRWGTILLVFLVLATVVMSYFIKYPEVIGGSAIISSKNPPVYLRSKVAGRMEQLLVANGEEVSFDQIVAELENPVPSASIVELRAFISDARTFMADSTHRVNKIDEATNLFDAANDYLLLKNKIDQYYYFLFEDGADEQLADLDFKLQQNRNLREVSKKEATLIDNDIANAFEKYNMKKQEYDQGFSTKLEMLNAQGEYNQVLKTKESINKGLIQADLTVHDFESQIREFRISRARESSNARAELEGLISNLENYVISWEQDFTLKAPTDGRLEYLGRIKNNQIIDPGKDLFAIIPPEGDLEVEVEIAAAGFGRVKEGQKVKLSINNYPANEYGTLNGLVSELPSLPGSDGYRIKVDLPNGMVSSYGIPLTYSPEMTAQAEVITEDLRLIERFFSSLRGIFSE